jgi:hypothetical protein
MLNVIYIVYCVYKGSSTTPQHEGTTIVLLFPASSSIRCSNINMRLLAFCATLFFLLLNPHQCWRTESSCVQRRRPTPLFFSINNDEQEPQSSVQAMDASSLSKSTEEITALQSQAQVLRAQAESLRLTLIAAKEAKRKKELANVDRWLGWITYSST